ncbi:MAG: hydantoinase B/oxoprolinase family protein, partial [Pararhodobacter sp.]|nr:hydantoinase B/oxoprolinase family protein [Pararhodobacter sp.]
EEKAFVPDSGGAGRHRGGLGQRVVFRKLVDDGRTTLASVFPEGVNNPIPGLFDGLAGGGASGRVLDPEGAEILDCGTGRLVELTTPAQCVEMILGGGAGYGDPAERDPDLVARDLRLGDVTLDYVQRYHPAALTPRARTAAIA